MRIAFFGKMGSGKTTAGEYLVEEQGFKRVSFATPLKAIGMLWQSTEYVEELEPELTEWANKLLPEPIYGKVILGQYGGITPRQYLVDAWVEDFRHSREKRELLQRIGTDSGRRVNPMIWINHFARHLPDGNLVVDDLRFQNEMQALKDLHFNTVKCEVPEAQRIIRLTERDGFFDPATQLHPSETELEHAEGDAVLHNDETITLDRFHRLVGEIAKVPEVVHAAG